MQQNIEDDNALELQLLYYIHSEIIQSEEIHKILWNQSIQNFEQLINQDYTVSVIGLYGIQKTVCEYLEKRLCNKIKLSDDALKHQRQCMICYINHENTYYIAFIALEDELTKDFYKENIVKNIELTLYRYLKDLCSQIILLPSKGILDGWKSLEQVSNYETSSVVQEYKIQDVQHDLISYEEIELRIDQQYIQTASKFLNGQGNIRASCGKKKQNYDLIDEKSLEKIFLQIWQGYQVSQIEFISDYSIQIQDILQQSAIQVQDWIDKKREKKQKKCQQEQNYLNIYFKEEFQVHDICKVVFQSIWNNMPINNKFEYNSKIQKALLKSIKKIHPDQYNNFKDNSKFIQPLRQIIDQQISILLHFYKQKQRKDSMTIKDIYDKFITQVSQRILKQNNQQFDLEIQLFKFSSIISGDKKRFGIIESISVQSFEVRQYFQVQNADSVSLVYFFITQKSKQNIFILQQQDKNNQYEYKWVYSQGDKNYKTIFTYKQQKNQLLFYYDQVNSKLYAFNCNNKISYLSFDEEKNVIIRDDSENCETKFSECCYLNYFSCFMLLSNENLFKWSSKNLEQIKLSQPQTIKFEKILSVGSGYFYALSDLKNFHILDFNHQVVASIQFQDYQIHISNKQQITLFADQSDWFLCLINDQRQITLQIKNVNTQSQITEKSIEENCTKYSNPFLDIIKDSEDKFGQPQLLICTSQKESELFVTKDVYDIIFQYFDHLALHITYKLIRKNCYQTNGSKVKINDLIFVMISRVALQLCTIDSSVLVPLQGGLYKRNFILIDQENTIDILDKIEKLKFGIFEIIQHFSQFKIFIVSIMGKQSCGKSYLFNRIFGTRFGVSSSRCTDGIQMSVSKIENTIFITLDCEGLFSQRRTSEEEKMLLIFLTGLSDVTILNQDLNFNRNMDEVLLNLANFSDQIHGDNLFQGKLMIAVRDVTQTEKEQAKNELLNNIQNIKNSQQIGNFLSRLFNGDFLTTFMSHFENKSFESQVQEIRKSLIKLSKVKCKWTNYQELLQTMKIMLVQLEVKDHRKIDDIIKEQKIRKVKNQAICLWQQYHIGDIDGINFSNLDNTFQVLQEFFIFKTNQIKLKMSHNEILKQSEYQIIMFLKERATLILKILQQSFGELFKDNNNLRIDIEQLLNNLCQQFLNCDQKCFTCNLSCKQRIRHSNQQQQYYDTIQKDILNEKDKQNRLNNQLKNQKIYCNQQHKDVIQQINNYNGELSYLILVQKKKLLLEDLQDYIEMDINEFKINEYILKFLQSNFNGIKNENNVQICEKIIQLEQLSIVDELKNKKGLLQNLLKQNQKFQVKQDKDNQQNQNILPRQQKLQEQINEVSKQIEYEKLKYEKLKQQNQQNTNKKQIFESLEQLQLKIDQRRNDLRTCHVQLTKIRSQLQLQKQEILERIQYLEIDFLLEIELLPQLDTLQQEHDKEYNKLENVKKYLQKYQGNFSQQNQITKINEDIQKIQQTLKINLQRQECLKEQINNLQQQGQKVTHEEVAQIFLENEQQQLIKQERDQNEQLYVIQIEINNLESELYSQNNNNKLINLEQVLQNCNSELEILNVQQLDDIEIKSQDSIELQDKITQINQEIDELEIIVQKNENNLQLFKKMKDQNNLLINYDSKLKEFYNMSLSGKDIQTLEKEVKKLNEQLQQLEEILKLNKQLEQSAIILGEQEQKLNNIKNEINQSHNCGFLNHDCDQICQCCNNPDIYCKFKAGHNDPTHLCENKQHFCKYKCNVEDCQNICQIEYGHKDNIPHNCQEYHQCHNQCNYCQVPCSFNASDDHQVHQCQKKYCNHECFFMKNCFDQIKCQNNCSKLHNENHDTHICQNSHQCNFTCDQPGICQIGNYTEKYTTKYTENGQFQFIIYEQNAQKRQCQFLIQKGRISHQGPHQCDKNVHSCNSRCPECNAYCDKVFGHQDKHSVNQHRNKEKQLFTLLVESQKDKVEIQEKGQESRIYRVGESCYPETCSKSCQRRDRAHFHLIPCPGQGECLAITLNKENIQVARHQPKQYLGSNLIYDEILCNQYWEYYKWEHPVDKKCGQLICLCNYYCQKCDKELNQKYFCTKLAWHTDSNNYDHQFPCSENHKFYGIDICFVIDSTLTMHPFAQLIRQSIQKFKNASDMYQKDQNAIQYSIVSYTDHDDQDIGYKDACVKHIDFTNHQSAQNFVNKIVFEYSVDYCEAMLDGLNKAASLKWRQKSLKYLFLIADAPPHGRNKFYNPQILSVAFDNYPNGCPCGLKEDAVLKRLNEIGIKLVVLKLNNYLNLTIQVFQNIMKQVIVLNSSEEMILENYINKMEEIICEQLRIEEITIGTD